jgi:hypothetical protein
MNRAEFARWLAGIRPAPHRVVAIDDNGNETPMAQLKGPNRWTRVANTMFEHKAVQCRCYDKAGALIDQADLADEDQAPLAAQGDVVAAIDGRTFSAAEVAAILAQAQVRTVEVTANAVTRAVERTMAAQSETTRVAFEQFADVNRTLVQRVAQLEQTVQDNIDDARDDIAEKKEEEKSGAQMEGLVMRIIEKKFDLGGLGAMFANGAPPMKKVGDGKPE